MPRARDLSGDVGVLDSLRSAVRKASAVSVALMLAGTLAVGCTPTEDSRPPDKPPGPQNAALTVSSIDKEKLSDDTRARMESDVSDLLAGYVVGAFLGDYPRDDFVDGFADFTGGATEDAVRDIDVLSVAGFQEVTSVRATALDSRLSFFVDGRRVTGASAWVDFGFVVQDGETSRRVTLSGRFVLQREGGDWAVFGYDLERSGTGGSLTLTAESSP
jgi:hypothetical protein